MYHAGKERNERKAHVQREKECGCGVWRKGVAWLEEGMGKLETGNWKIDRTEMILRYRFHH